MKVLVSAYCCEPDKGSEPGIGWNWARQIARSHRVWVITRERKKEGIERALAQEPWPNARFVYLDLPRWASFFKKDQRGVRLHYYLWQIAAYQVARRLQAEVTFDVVHHITFGTYWLPSFVSLLPARFIWGPVGGGESAPLAFRPAFGFRGRWYERLRDLARAVGRRDPFVRLTARRAAVAMAASSETAGELRKLRCRNVSVHSQIGLASADLDRLSALPPRRELPFRLLSLGRLLHWKGFELGLRAFARFARQRPGSEYWIVGDGPEAGRLRKLASELGVAGSVTFWGELPRPEVIGKLAQCDVLVHPSLHDSGGWVCLEAMAAGRPVVCLDIGGPAMLVTSETGVKLPAHNPEQVVDAMSESFERLCADPAWRLELGRRARSAAGEFSWEKRAGEMMRAYQYALTVGA